MNHKRRLAEAIVQLKNEQIYALIESASEMQAWAPVLEVCSYMNAKQQARMLSLSKEFDWDDVSYFSTLASELGLSEDLHVLLTGEVVKDNALGLSRFMPWKVKGY